MTELMQPVTKEWALAHLSQVLLHWCQREVLPFVCADDLRRFDNMRPEQVAWLDAFCLLWDSIDD